jgi:hypothetical protein
MQMKEMPHEIDVKFTVNFNCQEANQLWGTNRLLNLACCNTEELWLTFYLQVVASDLKGRSDFISVWFQYK